MLDPNAQFSVLETWMAAMGNVARRRESILTTRMDLKKERTLCHQQEEFFSKLMETFVALLNPVVDHSSYSECKNELDDLAKKIKGCWENLKALREKSNVLEDGLSNEEYQLAMLEQQIYSQLDGQLRTVARNAPSSFSQTSLATQQAARPPLTSPTQNPRDELYSRMGDLHIILSRINNFEFDLREELDERDVLRATGQIELSSDAVFFEETKAERARLQKDLEEAQSDVERLKQLCRREGIEFEDVKFHHPLHHDTDLVAFSAPSTQVDGATFALQEATPGILSSFFSATERVAKWLRDPASEEQRQGDPTAGDNGDSREAQESGLDADWEETSSWSGERRPSSAADNDAQHGMAVWTSGPQEIEALIGENRQEATKPAAEQATEQDSRPATA